MGPQPVWPDDLATQCCGWLWSSPPPFRLQRQSASWLRASWANRARLISPLQHFVSTCWTFSTSTCVHAVVQRAPLPPVSSYL